jgi:hypothetical protein
LFAGNGRAPLRLAPIPKSGTNDPVGEDEIFPPFYIDARREILESLENAAIKPSTKNKLKKTLKILCLDIVLKTSGRVEFWL